MTLLMVLALMAAASVGFWQAEKAKQKRKAAEERVGNKLNQQLDFGSFEMETNQTVKGKEPIQLSDNLEFEPAGEGQVSVVHKGDVIGQLPVTYLKFDLFLEALRVGKHIVGKCVKVGTQAGGSINALTVSFEVKQ